MNRRNFLVSGLSAAALRAQSSPVSIGFLGASHSHGLEKIRLVSKSPAFRLLGVAEPRLEIARSVEALGVPILSQERLLSDASLQAIAVESEVRDHARHARLVLEAGKHLHVEKPAATTLAEFRDLLTLAAAKQRLVQSGYMWRLHPGFRAAFEAVHNGWLGEVYLVRGMMNMQLDGTSRELLAAFPGGQMFELAGHLVDPIARLFGRPGRVTPFLRHDAAVNDTLRDNTLAVFEYPRMMAILSSSAMQPAGPRHRSFEILGSNGTLVLQPIEPGVLQVDLQTPAGPYRAGLQKVEIPPFHRYLIDLEEFATAIRDNRPLAVTPGEELLVHETLLRACAMA